MYKMYYLLVLSLWLHADMLPQNVLAKNCLNSYSNTYLSQNNHKAFVYARESETDKDRCNWAYGYATTQEAIESAMRGCQSVMLNAECITIDTDGIFMVTDNTFSRLTPVDDTPLSSDEKQKLIQAAKTLILGNCLPFFSQKYLEAPGHKAFGYSIDVNGNYACGYSYGNQTEKVSKKQAIKSCNDNKAKRGAKAPKSPCKVYAQNKSILLKASDFGVEAIKEAKKLSQAEYEALFSQAKKTIRSWPCQIQFKYFLKSKIHHAFYLSTLDNGKQTCGRSECTLNLQIAKAQAKNNCEARLKKEKLHGVCKPLAQDTEIVATKDTFVGHKPLTQNKTSKTALDMNKPLPLAETLKITAATLNKDLPTMIDSELRMDSVKSDKSTMTFLYTLVHITRSEMPANKLRELMYEDMKVQVCTDKDTRVLFKKGMHVNYEYYGKNKEHITTFAFDAKVCGMQTRKEKLKSFLKSLGKK